ncbi:hypothetical protein E2C01_025777 [Portunus trituberculatus]|uniref:Uncharacterized protein n=1 Tax=Portunus trituberculatus TaxID=210409 RepID=A0A5B7EH15_PORTR|nr:hypothetical protein [Portunus trituberculatus]
MGREGGDGGGRRLGLNLIPSTASLGLLLRVAPPRRGFRASLNGAPGQGGVGVGGGGVGSRGTLPPLQHTMPQHLSTAGEMQDGIGVLMCCLLTSE